MSVHQVSIQSTGYVEITRIENLGERDETLKEVLHSEQLKQYGNFWIPPEPQPFVPGRKIKIHLKDVSGAENTVYIALYCLY